MSEPAAGDQNADQNSPTDTAGDSREGTPQAPQGGQDDGKGGKAAVLADLASERDKRQALEREFSAFRDGLAELSGLKPKQLTPEQATKAVTDAHADRDQARLELAVFRGAAAHGADPDALLDSGAFLRSIQGIDPADAAAIADAIKAAVDQSPRYRNQATPAAGARDANAASPPFTDADATALRVLGY